VGKDRHIHSSSYPRSSGNRARPYDCPIAVQDGCSTKGLVTNVQGHARYDR